MKKRKKRRDKGAAILKFIICLLVLIIIAMVLFLILKPKKNSGTTQATPVPVVTIENEVTPEPTPAVTATPAPAPDTTIAASTPQVTVEPSLTIITTPEASPTPIPSTVLSVHRTDITLPEAEDSDGEIGISRCYVDQYHILQIEGWGYVNRDYFNGAECGTYLVVTQAAANKSIAYLASNVEGISGHEPLGAICKNPKVCDWVAYIDVAGDIKYDPGTYNLSLMLCYKNGDSDAYSYYRFSPLQSFTVNDGEIINPVTPTTAIVE